MIRRLLFVLLALIGCGGYSLVRAQAVSPDDFARGLRLDVAEGEAVQVLLVPPVVYQTVTTDDLADVRVFNGDGEEVPHALYSSGLPRPVSPVPVALPLFPIRGAERVPIGDLTVQVERTESGALVAVRERESGARDQPIQAYLLDASALNAPMQRLVITWPDSAQNVLAEVEVATSDDLQAWRSWGRATLARMQYAGQSLVQNEIALPQRQARYVRLTWAEDARWSPVKQVEAVPDGEAEPDRQWVSLEPAAAEPTQYVFDQRGVLPVDRVELELPQPNTLARVTMASSVEREGSWQRRYDGLIYRLQLDGRELTSPPLVMPRTTDRFWRMTVDPAGGGLGQGAPTLRLGWTPERLLFVARGAAPYTVAFGSAGVEAADFSPREILRLIPGPEEAVLRQPLATVADTVALGGPSRLTPDEELPWAQYLLWGALILGVVFLTVLTVRLIRQIDADGSAAETSSES
jgi:hypothetical protein